MPQDKLLSPSIKWATPSLNFLFQGTRAQFIFVKYLPLWQINLVCAFICQVCSELNADWHFAYTHTHTFMPSTCRPPRPLGLCKNSLFTSNLFHIVLFLWLIFQADLHTCIFPTSLIFWWFKPHTHPSLLFHYSCCPTAVFRLQMVSLLTFLLASLLAHGSVWCWLCFYQGNLYWNKRITITVDLDLHVCSEAVSSCRFFFSFPH